MTVDELETFAASGNLLETFIEPAKVGQTGSEESFKRWKEADRILRDRSREELECYAKSGLRPEQRDWQRYSM
jgi:hypothetical protein